MNHRFSWRFARVPRHWLARRTLATGLATFGVLSATFVATTTGAANALEPCPPPTPPAAVPTAPTAPGAIPGQPF